MLAQSAPTPPQPPPPPAIGATEVVPAVQGTPVTGDPAEIYRALKQQNQVLRSQQSELQDQRRAIANRLREGRVDGADKAGLEGRLTTLDQQINELDKRIAASNTRVADAAGIPGAIQPDPPSFDQGPPDSVVAISIVFILSTLLPISIAFARRIWRRSSPPAPAAPSQAASDRMTRIEEAVEAIAIEVERVGEGQRYLTKVLASGPAEPLPVQQRESLRESIRMR